MVEKKNLRIVYMGTPDFAVEALRCLVEGGYNVVGVITMPDKPAGRGIRRAAGGAGGGKHGGSRSLRLSGGHRRLSAPDWKDGDGDEGENLLV